MLSCYPNFADFLAAETDESALARLRRAESIGRPLGDEAFLGDLERRTRRRLRPAKRGLKVRAEGGVSDSLFRALSPNCLLPPLWMPEKLNARATFWMNWSGYFATASVVIELLS